MPTVNMPAFETKQFMQVEAQRQQSQSPRLETPSFFLENGLSQSDYDVCRAVIRRWHPRAQIDVLGEQGACSFTFSVRLPTPSISSDDESNSTAEPARRIVQLRPLRYALDPLIAARAQQVYGALAPELYRCKNILLGPTHEIALQICEMSYVPGNRVDLLQEQERQPQQQQASPQRVSELEDLRSAMVAMRRSRRLMRDLAGFFARGWRHAVTPTSTSSFSFSSSRALPAGRIARSIPERLQRLEYELPSADLRARARRVRAKVDAGGLERLPVVLNHGDFLPRNVLVDSKTGGLIGIVDWAEAEELPFGITLYGIEHFLGESTEKQDHDTKKARWRYREGHEELRSVFWDCLFWNIAASSDRGLQEAVALSREVGILLWHGFAWDDGSLDRVVNYADDREELVYLETFLGCAVRHSKSRL